MKTVKRFFYHRIFLLLLFSTISLAGFSQNTYGVSFNHYVLGGSCDSIVVQFQWVDILPWSERGPLSWSFGDGTSVNGSYYSIIHVYNSSGPYTVFLDIEALGYYQGYYTRTITLPPMPGHYSTTIDTTVCDKYISPYSNSLWNSSGTYWDTLRNALSCDTIVTINLTINNTGSLITPVACDNYSSPSGNYIWTQSGSYLDTIPNSLGCDSIITVNLTINNNTASLITPVACDNYTSPSGNYIWTNSGSYRDTIPNSLGCDSIIIVFLTINNNNASVINPVVCNNYTSPSGNYIWTQSGSYLDTIPNSLGCDSVITINLSISPLSKIIDLVNDRYLSCGQTCLNLTSNTPNGGGPYSYIWSTASTNKYVHVCPTGTTAYYLTVSDTNGCTLSDTATVVVSDTLCGAGKVTICKSLRNRQFSYCIDTAQLAYNLSQGSTLGCCTNAPPLQQGPGGTGGIFSKVYPNPFTLKTTIEFSSTFTGLVSVEVFNSVGQRVAKLFSGEVEENKIYHAEFYQGDLPTGVYFAKISSQNNGVQYHKLLVSDY